MENSEKRIGHPSPPIRPNVEIVESKAAIKEIDCVELRWWFGIPRPGDHTMRASYDAETLKLRCVTDMEARAPARIHGIDCVEMQVSEWSVERGCKTDNRVFYARVEDASESRWIAVMSEENGRKVFLTLLDEEFES